MNPEPSLLDGDIEVVGLLPWASNYSLLGMLNGKTPVVYKPRKGESPLWDFPQGTLCLREVAAYLVSEAGGWNFVPPTVLRQGPLGIGAVQLFVDHDPNTTAFDLLGKHDLALRRIAAFDLVINNADRKAGHVLLADDLRLWAVDHGISFHSDPKLRTVLWDFAGLEFDQEELKLLGATLLAVSGDFCAKLAELLSAREMDALNARLEGLLAEPVFPHPGPGRNYPWPPT